MIQGRAVLQCEDSHSVRCRDNSLHQTARTGQHLLEGANENGVLATRSRSNHVDSDDCKGKTTCTPAAFRELGWRRDSVGV